MKLFRILCVMSLAMLVLISSGCANTQQTAAPTAETVPAEAEEPVSAPEEETVTSEQPEEPAAVESPAGASDVPEGATSEETAPAAETETAAEPKSAGRDKLVIFFSRTGEQYTVGVIEKGNTSIVAEMIAEIADADLFEVLPVDDHYPMTYNALTDVAKQEQNAKARPEYSGTLPDLAQYDTIFIGAPVWCSGCASDISRYLPGCRQPDLMPGGFALCCSTVRRSRHNLRSLQGALYIPYVINPLCRLSLKLHTFRQLCRLHILI